MAIRKIRINDDPILRKKASEVKIIDDYIKELIEDMFETMYENDGLGLAAPQIGVLRRIVVIEIDDRNTEKQEKEGKPKDQVGKYVFINPVITKSSGEQLVSEGCLSFPGMRGKVRRPLNLTVEYLDEFGKKQIIKAEGLLAHALSHEIDHLDGIVYVEKVEEGTLVMEEEDDSTRVKE